MHACREHVLIPKLHRLMTDLRGSHALQTQQFPSRVENFLNLMLVTQNINIHVWDEIWQVMICCGNFFHFETANQKKNETQFSNPISTTDFFYEFKTDFVLDFHFARSFLEEKRKSNYWLITTLKWVNGKCSTCTQMIKSARNSLSLAEHRTLSESQLRDDPSTSDPRSQSSKTQINRKVVSCIQTINHKC